MAQKRQAPPPIRPDLKAMSDTRKRLSIEQGLTPASMPAIDVAATAQAAAPPVVVQQPLDPNYLEPGTPAYSDAYTKARDVFENANDPSSTKIGANLRRDNATGKDIRFPGPGEWQPDPNSLWGTPKGPPARAATASAIDAGVPAQQAADGLAQARAKLEAMQGDKPHAWQWQANIAARVTGTSDAPPTTDVNGGYDEWLFNRYAGIQNDQALDGLMRPQFEQIAAGNPVAAANGQNIGDVWRTVQALTPANGAQPQGQQKGQQPTPGGPKPPADRSTIGLPWGKQYPDVGTMLGDWAAGAAGVANDLLGIKPAKGAEAQAAPAPMTPDQALKFLTGAQTAPPPPTKGPLDAAFQVMGDVTKAVAANTVDAVAQVAPGVYGAVKAALDGIDQLSSAAAGAAGNVTGIQFLKDYAQGGLGIPAASDVFGDPNTPAGAVSRSIAQFLTGFAIGGKALEGLGWATGGGAVTQGTRFLAQGAVADAGFFDGQSGKLSDLLVQVPALKNPVTEYLASGPNDSQAEGRFKNALNGLIATPLIPVFVGVVRGMRGLGQLAGVLKAAPADAAGAATPGAVKPTVPKTLLGDASPDAPLTVSPAAAKIATAQGEVAANASGLSVPASSAADVSAPPVDRLAGDPGALAKVVSKYKFDAGSLKVEDAFTTLDDAATSIRDLQDEVAAITADERAALKPGEVFTAEADLQTAQASAVKTALALRNQVAAIHDNAAGMVGAAKSGSATAGVQSLTADQAQAIADTITRPAAGKAAHNWSIADATSDVEVALDSPDAAVLKQHLTTLEAETRRTLAEIDAVLGIKSAPPNTPAVAPSAARVGPPAGYTAIGGGPAGGPQVFANFAAIKTGDDIQKIANDMVAAYEDTTDAARQGVITNAQTKAAAGELDAFDTLMARRTGEAPNAAQVYAWRSLYEGSLRKLQEVAQKASQAPLSDAPAALLQMREMQSVVLAVQKEFYGARAEAGRALQAFKITPDQAMAAKQAEALLNQYGGIDANVDLARKIAAINDPRALADFVEASVFTKAKDAWQQLFYFNVLSSPKTHVRNFVGNNVMLGLNILESSTAAQFSRVMGDDAVKAGEAVAQWYGIKMAFGDAMQAAARTWKTGESTGGYGLNKVDFPQRNAISADAWGLADKSVFGRSIDVLGAVTQSTSRALATSDEFFKTVGASATGYQLAFRQAQDRLARGIITADQVPDYIAQTVANFPGTLDTASRAAVADKAAYMTFTTPPKPGGFVDLLLKARAIGDQPDASLGAKGFGIAARMVVPFVNTPSNILLATFERTPLAPFTARYRDAMAKGGADAYTANARMAVGSMTMATWVDLSMNGTITGKGPDDPSQYAALYATGWRPFSVKFGDKYVSYQGLEPFSTILGWGAQIGEVLSNSDMAADPTAQANFEKVIAASVFAIGDVVLSKTYLSSASDLIDAINSGNATAAENYIKKYGAGLLVPNAVRDVKSALDPVQRYTTSIIEEARSRIPGLSADLPPRRDAFGFVKSYQSGFGTAYDAISPFYASTVKDLPIASAMLKDGWAISSPQMAFSIDGQRVDVTNQPVIYSRFLELRGQVKPSALTSKLTPNYAASDRYASGDAADAWVGRLQDRYGDRSMVDTLNAIVSESPPFGLQDQAEKYHSFTDADARRKFITGIVADYQDAAKAVLFSEYPDLLRRAAQLKAAGQQAQP